MILELPKDEEKTVTLDKIYIMQNKTKINIKYKVQGEDGWIDIKSGLFKLPALTVILKAAQTTKVVLQPTA